MIQRIVRSCRAIFLKTALIFSNNFPDFRSDNFEKQSVLNLSSYYGKSYTIVILCDSEDAFQRETDEEAFCPFLCWILSKNSVA